MKGPYNTACCINIIVRGNQIEADTISDGEFASADQAYSLMTAFFTLTGMTNLVMMILDVF